MGRHRRAERDLTNVGRASWSGAAGGPEVTVRRPGRPAWLRPDWSTGRSSGRRRTGAKRGKEERSELNQAAASPLPRRQQRWHGMAEGGSGDAGWCGYAAAQAASQRGRGVPGGEAVVAAEGKPVPERAASWEKRENCCQATNPTRFFSFLFLAYCIMVLEVNRSV